MGVSAHACLRSGIPHSPDGLAGRSRSRVRVGSGRVRLAPLLAVNCRLWLADRLWNWPVLVATLAIAGLLAAGSQLRRTSRSTGEEPSFLSRAAILSLAMPAFAWLSLAMTASVHRPGGRLLYLALVASPAVVFAADQIATHAIFWLTANVQVDYATLSAWRADWATATSLVRD